MQGEYSSLVPFESSDRIWQRYKELNEINPPLVVKPVLPTVPATPVKKEFLTVTSIPTSIAKAKS